jgi:hypothetical protein
MFRNVQYILIKDVKKFKRKAELGNYPAPKIKEQINEIFEETVKTKNLDKTTKAIEDGFCYFQQNMKTFKLLYSELPIGEAQAYSIIDKIEENFLDIKLLRNEDDEHLPLYIYNIVDSVFGEDEYFNLRVPNNTNNNVDLNPFYINKYREALLTVTSDIKSKHSESNFRRNIKLIIIMSIIMLGIFLAVIIPIVV